MSKTTGAEESAWRGKFALIALVIVVFLLSGWASGQEEASSNGVPASTNETPKTQGGMSLSKLWNDFFCAKAEVIRCPNCHQYSETVRVTPNDEPHTVQMDCSNCGFISKHKVVYTHEVRVSCHQDEPATTLSVPHQKEIQLLRFNCKWTNKPKELQYRCKD